MISIKTGTQTYSEKPNSASLGGQDANTLSSDEMEKYYGNKPIGDILNQVADPNWVDPAKKMRAVGSDKMDKDAFMKLLMTQIKNQDPSNPMQSHEMAAQLAQFSSLEQLSNMNTNIEALVKKENPNNNFDVLKMIGMAVRGDSSKISRASMDDSHDIQFTLRKEAQNVTLKIKDAAGNVVRELQAFNLKQGKNEVSWNGEISDGTMARKGDYTVEVKAKNMDSQVAVETAFQGVVSGVNFSASGPVLMIGNKSVKLSDIKNIVDPSKLNENKAGINKVEAKAVDSNTGTQTQVQTQLDGVAMSRDIISKLKKAGAQTKAY